MANTYTTKHERENKLTCLEGREMPFVSEEASQEFESSIDRDKAVREHQKQKPKRQPPSVVIANAQKQAKEHNKNLNDSSKHVVRQSKPIR